MKCGIRVSEIELTKTYQIWFGPDQYNEDWELSCMILEYEFRTGKIRIARNRLERKYKRICSRLKMNWEY